MRKILSLCIGNKSKEYISEEQKRSLGVLAKKYMGVTHCGRLDTLCQFFRFQQVDSEFVTNCEHTGVLDRLIIKYGKELSKVDKLTNFLILLGRNRYYADRLTNKEQTGFCDRLIAQDDFLEKVMPLAKALRSLRAEDIKTKMLINDKKDGVLDVLIEKPVRLLEILPIVIDLYKSGIRTEKICKKGLSGKQKKLFVEYKERYDDFCQTRGFMTKPHSYEDLFTLEQDIVLILSLFEKYAPKGFRHLGI